MQQDHEVWVSPRVRLVAGACPRRRSASGPRRPWSPSGSAAPSAARPTTGSASDPPPWWFLFSISAVQMVRREGSGFCIDGSRTADAITFGRFQFAQTFCTFQPIATISYIFTISKPSGIKTPILHGGVFPSLPSSFPPCLKQSISLFFFLHVRNIRH